MLTRFSVSNSKNFKEKIEFEPGKTYNYEYSSDSVKNGVCTKGIIYGINGSGKSNLGLALFDLINHLTDKQKLTDKYIMYLNLDSVKDSADFEYEFIFNNLRVEYKYSKTNNQELLKESFIINNEELIFYDYLNNKGFSKLLGSENINLNSDEKISRLKVLNGNSLLDLQDEKVKCFKDFMSFVNKMLLFYSLDDKRYEGFAVGTDSITAGIIRANKVKEFQEFLYKQGIVYEFIIGKTNGVDDLYCKFNNDTVQFMAIASTGTRSLALWYYWYIRMNEAKFVYIDEFDAFYHFKLAKNIVECLTKLKDTQIFLTSHNTDLITNDLLRPDCYFIIKNNKVEALSYCINKDLRKAHNIQKMFKAGAFDE